MRQKNATTSAIHENGTDLPLIGLDVGYGYTKIAREDGEVFTFPSLVAPCDVSLINLGLDAMEQPVIVEGARYTVGEKALERSWRFKEQWDGWWVSPTYKAILAHAKQYIPQKAQIITGLPLHVFINSEARSQVTEIIRRMLQAADALVLPQGVGAYCSIMDDYAQCQRVAIVDIGMRTTELIAMAGARFLAHQSSGLIHGIEDILNIVGHELSNHVGRTIDPYEVDLAYRRIRPIFTQGHEIPATSIDERLAGPARQRAENLIKAMTQLWGAGASAFDQILYCGGGAHYLFPYLASYRTGCQMVKNPQLANAIGFLTIGQKRRSASALSRRTEHLKDAFNNGSMSNAHHVPLTETPA